MDFRDPRTTVQLLDELVELGLTQHLFWQSHHTDKTASIGGHRGYSSNRVTRFYPGPGNADTAHRLAQCLEHRKAGESWESAISKALIVVPFSGVRGFLPTADDEKLEAAVSELATQQAPATPPLGQPKPGVVETGSGKRFVRDSYIAVWVERRANGRCEHCGEAAPFVRSDGRPFLEVHHVVRLADGGSDTHTNTVAVCPNCHRLLHHSPTAIQAADRLYAQVSELRRESPALVSATPPLS